MLNPQVCGTSTGLYGRTVVSLKAANKAVLPSTNLSSGDIVSLAIAKDSGIETIAKGVSHFCVTLD